MKQQRTIKMPKVRFTQEAENELIANMAKEGYTLVSRSEVGDNECKKCGYYAYIFRTLH